MRLPHPEISVYTQRLQRTAGFVLYLLVPPNPYLVVCDCPNARRFDPFRRYRMIPCAFCSSIAGLLWIGYMIQSKALNGGSDLFASANQFKRTECSSKPKTATAWEGAAHVLPPVLVLNTPADDSAVVDLASLSLQPCRLLNPLSSTFPLSARSLKSSQAPVLNCAISARKSTANLGSSRPEPTVSIAFPFVKPMFVRSK